MVDAVRDEKLRGAGGFSAEGVKDSAYSGIKVNHLLVDGAGAGGMFVYEGMGVFEETGNIAVEGFVGEVNLRIHLGHHQIPPAFFREAIGVFDGNGVVGNFEFEGTTFGIEERIFALGQFNPEIAAGTWREFLVTLAGGDDKKHRKQYGDV